MPPRGPVDPRLVAATRHLARRGLSYAEIVRALQPLTVRVGAPAPSYSTVRRIASEVRRSPPLRDPYARDPLEDLLSGRMPRMHRTNT